ncbi:MAG TPA: sigma-70 family RNA polymerase sigma factor [Kofleriaceae bacterium]|nr:sigma-70 family RNA polymerase sigma factor [Kofleriaceae bacterium]
MTALAQIAVDPTVAAAAAGDRGAAEALCRALLPRVRNLVRYLLRGDARVDDVAQEALIAVLRGLGSFRGEGRFEAWVDRVVARTTFAVIRRIRAETQPGAEPVDGDAGAHDRASFDDGYALRRELAEALDRLPGEQREALVLHFALEMTVPEIAEAAAAPIETVRSRLRLGKAALREALGGSDARAI